MKIGFYSRALQTVNDCKQSSSKEQPQLPSAECLAGNQPYLLQLKWKTIKYATKQSQFNLYSHLAGKKIGQLLVVAIKKLFFWRE